MGGAPASPVYMREGRRSLCILDVRALKTIMVCEVCKPFALVHPAAAECDGGAFCFILSILF